MLAGGAVASSFAQDGLNPSQTAVLPDKTGPAVPPPAAAASVEAGTPPQTAPQPSTEAPAAPGAAADKAPPPSGQLSPWYYEIERLTQAGVEDAVILSYIYNSAGTFNLTADQVIALKTLGASPQVINAMMRHDRQLIAGERPLTASTPPPFPPAVQAALSASLHPTEQGSTEPAAQPTPAPAPGASIIAPDDESSAHGTLVWVEPYDLPDPPQGLYPVRLPYPVKLNDPIIMLRLPSFALPCW
jgi:hypothetical protein